MAQSSLRFSLVCLVLASSVSLTGCACFRHKGSCDNDCGCETSCCDGGCCEGESCGCGSSWCGAQCCGFWHRFRSNAIPETLPLGSTVRAHYHTMQTNAEAADFIIHDCEFVGSTAELTPAGKDHIVEIAARMPSAPFPIIVERSENNSDPELDAHRRELVARILHDFGAPEADQRTIVAPAYGRGINSLEGEQDYYRFVFTRGFGGAGGGWGGGAGGGYGGSSGGGW